MIVVRKAIAIALEAVILVIGTFFIFINFFMINI
jgi:hypothetical protein